MTRVKYQHDFIRKLAGVAASDNKVRRKVVEAVQTLLFEVHNIYSLVYSDRIELSVVFLCALVKAKRVKTEFAIGLGVASRLPRDVTWIVLLLPRQVVFQGES